MPFRYPSLAARRAEMLPLSRLTSAQPRGRARVTTSPPRGLRCLRRTRRSLDLRRTVRRALTVDLLTAVRRQRRGRQGGLVARPLRALGAPPSGRLRLPGLSTFEGFVAALRGRRRVRPAARACLLRDCRGQTDRPHELAGSQAEPKQLPLSMLPHHAFPCSPQRTHSDHTRTHECARGRLPATRIRTAASSCRCLPQLSWGA